MPGEGVLRFLHNRLCLLGPWGGTEAGSPVPGELVGKGVVTNDSLCPHLPDPQTWASHHHHHLLLVPAMTATSSPGSPAIRARGQHWTSKSKPKENTEAGREPVGVGQLVDSSPPVPAPLESRSPDILIFSVLTKGLFFPQACWDAKKEKGESYLTRVGQSGVVALWG